MDNTFTKFKYMLGEPTFPGRDKKFDGINMPDAGIEGNTIVGNNKYIAVSILKILMIICIVTLETRRWRMCSCTRSPRFRKV